VEEGERQVHEEEDDHCARDRGHILDEVGDVTLHHLLHLASVADQAGHQVPRVSVVEEAHREKLGVLIDVRPKPVYRPLRQYLTQVSLEILTDLLEAERQAEEYYHPRKKPQVRPNQIAPSKHAVDEDEPYYPGLRQLESGGRDDRGDDSGPDRPVRSHVREQSKEGLSSGAFGQQPLSFRRDVCVS